MTVYGYRCIDCPVTKDFQFPIGEAPTEIVTSEHSPHTFYRVITAPSVVVSGGTKAGYVRR
jgi:predicted nucleic acid-binding Zn ribbon protein